LVCSCLPWPWILWRRESIIEALMKMSMGHPHARGPNSARTSRPPKLDHLIEVVLNGAAGAARVDQARRVLSFNPRETKAVILGGGTGLSTVVGGNSQTDRWSVHPFVGLKQEFPLLDVVVCTTDDGGSTGSLLRQLPMIAVGDIRKSLVSSIRLDMLRQVYGFSWPEALAFVHLIQGVFHYRFPERCDPRLLEDPLLAVSSPLRQVCPKPLAAELRRLGRFISPGGEGPEISPGGHCLGNLLLTSSIFKAAGGSTDRAPTLSDTYSGINGLCELVGVQPGSLHPATGTPGQLKFRYTNGVEVYGQSKSAHARRGFPVDWLEAEFSAKPVVSAAVLRAIRRADIIIFAPGSLYTSIIPILQLPPIVEAIRSNREALKILGANFWIQAGETDISLRQSGRGFLVSDLIEAYDRNVLGGARGLFQVVLSANLEHVPGNILRNYALEGKSPIHLDRKRVEEMGFHPVEATLFAPDFRRSDHVIHHDPERFALTVRTLLYAWNCLEGVKRGIRRQSSGESRLSRGGAVPPPARRGVLRHRGPLLCEYMRSIEQALSRLTFNPPELRGIMAGLAWENRDIRPRHLAYLRGIEVVGADNWDRSNAWDRVLGYYDPEKRRIRIHEKLLQKPTRLREDLLIALGESLLGRYIESRRWLEGTALTRFRARCYEIRLRPERKRECFLSDTQLHKYLALSRMLPDVRDAMTHRITIGHNEGFLPPGLLFGLLYAWYLNNTYAATMEYEMSLLRWPPAALIPHQAKERARKQALVDFFCTEVFGHRRE